MTATLSASELIRQLQALIEQHGDLPVYTFSTGTGPSTYVEVGEVVVGKAWFTGGGEEVARAVLLHWWKDLQDS